jgi:hypothetical protein
MAKQKYLRTRSGLLAASAIVLIGPRKWEREYEIDYCNGSEPHSTVAGWQDVEEFLGHEYEVEEFLGHEYEEELA